MDIHQIRDLIRQELPNILREDRAVRQYLVALMQERSADRLETESRFDAVLDELRRGREEEMLKWLETTARLDRKMDEDAAKRVEQERKWAEITARMDRKMDEDAAKWTEQTAKWAEQERSWAEITARLDRKMDEDAAKWVEQTAKWQEHGARLDRMLDAIEAQGRRHDQSIGALGARWGMQTEQSFRNGLAAILTGTFDVEVANVTEYDAAGEVFGRPDQVELDVIVQDGDLIICEIKSSMSKSDMVIFDRKVAFYEKRHDRKASRKLVISPMVHPAAQEVAQALGIEVYSYAEDVVGLA
jgi:hypothetical protein